MKSFVVTVVVLSTGILVAGATFHGPKSNMQRFKDEGISVSSSGNCFDRNRKRCTSLDGMQESTINGLINFKRECGNCRVVVTGGTEIGHSRRGNYNHGTGHKVDIRLNNTVNKYITENFTRTGTRLDGAALYVDGNGNVFALERNHCDILFQP